jgi:hypothetical protein
MSKRARETKEEGEEVNLEPEITVSLLSEENIAVAESTPTPTPRPTEESANVTIKTEEPAPRRRKIQLSAQKNEVQRSKVDIRRLLFDWFGDNEVFFCDLDASGKQESGSIKGMCAALERFLWLPHVDPTGTRRIVDGGTLALRTARGSGDPLQTIVDPMGRMGFRNDFADACDEDGNAKEESDLLALYEVDFVLLKKSNNTMGPEVHDVLSERELTELAEKCNIEAISLLDC